jgi:hypothetical protein
MVRTSRIHFGWRAFVFICVVAAAIAALAMYAAWNHNPQLVFHENGVIHWGAWLAVGISWFATIAGVPCIIALGVLLTSFLRRSQ